MSKLVCLFSLILFLFGCQKTAKLEGPWDMALTVQEKTIGFQLVFKGENKVDLINGPETIPLAYEIDGKTIIIPILNFDARLELEPKADMLGGHWVRPNKEPAYKEPVAGTKAEEIKGLPNFDLAPKWKMEFVGEKENQEAILIFTEKGDGKFASVLTPTGDYRFLTPRKEGDRLILSGFDGVFAFYFEGELKDDAYRGTMYSGKSWNQPFKAVVDEDFELPDPTKTTKYAGNLKDLKLPRLHGPPETVINARNKDKVKVVQIFGSWCPNCIDETRFISEWRDSNPEKDVNFSMISFERSPNKKSALKSLRKAQELYGIDYPIYIGGYTPEDKVSDVLPGLENFISFPTTLILDKNNIVRKVHAGFSGPATGKYYEKFIMDFNALIEKLLEE